MISNTITITRILFTPLLFALLAYGDHQYRWFALALFLGAGVLDLADGFAARKFNEVSKFGAMIDLIGDRLLTYASLLGLIVAGDVQGLALVAAAILIARDTVVASLNEALPGRLKMTVSTIEKIKIAGAFLGITLLLAPPLFADQQSSGSVVLCIAAAITLITLADYWMRGLRGFRDLKAETNAS